MAAGWQFCQRTAEPQPSQPQRKNSGYLVALSSFFLYVVSGLTLEEEIRSATNYSCRSWAAPAPVSATSRRPFRSTQTPQGPPLGVSPSVTTVPSMR